MFSTNPCHEGTCRSTTPTRNMHPDSSFLPLSSFAGRNEILTMHPSDRFESRSDPFTAEIRPFEHERHCSYQVKEEIAQDTSDAYRGIGDVAGQLCICVIAIMAMRCSGVSGIKPNSKIKPRPDYAFRVFPVRLSMIRLLTEPAEPHCSCGACLPIPRTSEETWYELCRW
ncbi:hypothetical protein Moror_4585 [Moniliophthora roreri MCA 2997]|uniref:Uncharacterized protein n=1 Tax=Moniliophthora roreri (strain MCA 2997) TaxID=1381753 RepID=V2XIN7_MONRO|nr:hypothetical protein Moror_4585 [Moniliophthora roreri MCA 2997]